MLESFSKSVDPGDRECCISSDFLFLLWCPYFTVSLTVLAILVGRGHLRVVVFVRVFFRPVVKRSLKKQFAQNRLLPALEISVRLIYCGLAKTIQKSSPCPQC